MKYLSSNKMESYLALATLVAACGAAKLDRAYLPPASASSAGGSAGSLQTPFGNHASAKSSVGNPGSLQIPFGNQSDQSPEGSAGSLQSLIDQHPAFAKSSAPGHHAFAKASSSPGGQASAKASAGSAGNKLNYGLGGPVPKGSYTNEYQGVVVDAALAGTRATGESGLGAPRPTYGSSDSKVGAAAFRDQPSRFNQTPQAQGQPGGSSGQGQQGQSGSQPDYNQGSQGFNQPQPNQLERPKAAQDRVATITKLEQEVGPENFNFAFETDNGIQAEETGVEANGVQAQGAFSYTGDDGNTYTVTYTADENGYQPKGDHLPTPPPIPEEILKSLEQNAKDEAAGIVDDGSYDAKKYNTGGDYTDDNNDGKYTHQFGANGEIDASASGSFIDQTRQPFGKPELSRPHNRPNSLGQNAKPGKFDYHGARPSASGSSNQLTGPDSQSAGQFSQSGAYSGTSNQENSGQSSGQFNQASSNSGFGFASAPQGNPSQGFGNGNEYLPPTNNYGQQSSQSQSQNHLQARPQSRPQARPQVSSNSESSFGSSNQLNGPDFQSTGQIGPSGAYNGTPNQENNGQYSGQFNQDSSNYNGFGFASGANAPQRNPSLGFVNGNKNVPPTNNYGQQSSQSQPQNRPQARPQSKPQARPQESGSSESGFGFSNQLTGPDSQSAGQFGPSGAYSRPPNQENNAQSLGQFNQAFSNSKLNNGFGFGSGANVPQGNPSQGFGNRNEYLPPTNNYGQQDSQRPQNRPQARPQNKPQNRPQDSGSSESSSSEENSSEEKGSVNIQPQQYSQEGSQEIFTTQGLPSRVSGKPNVLPGLSDFESRPIQGESQKLSTPQRFPSRVSSKPNAFPSQSSFGSKPTQNQLSGNGLKPSNNNNFGQSGQSNQAQSGFGNNNEYLPPFSQQHSQNGNATESNQQFNNQAPGFQSPLSLPGNSQGRPQSSFPGQAPTQAPSKLIPGFPSHQFNNLQRPQNGRPIQNGQFSQQNVAQFSQASAISTGFTPQPGNGLTTPIRSSNDQSQFDQSTPSPFPGGSSPFLIGSIQPQFGNQFNGQYSSPTSSFSSTPSFGSQPTFAPSPDSRPFENQYQGAQFISQAQNSFSQSQNVDSKFSPSTQRPSYAQPIGSDDSYIYNQPSQPFSGQEQGFPNLVASFPGQPSFPNEATSFPNKVSRFPSSNQRVTQSPSIPTDLYSNTPGNFPSTFSNSGFPKEVSSFPNQDSRFPSTSSSQKVTPSYPSDRYSNAPGNFPLTPAAQYSPQGPINYPNPPTLSSPAPTSSTQYQGNTVSGITQASISSFPSVASTQAPFNQQHQFQSRPGFQQSVNQYNPAQAPQSPNFESVSTTAAPQSFPQSPESQDQQSYGQESTQSTEDSSDAPESSQQYQGELYEYNKPAQTPPPPENEGQPGAGQFGSTTQDQKTTQPDSDGYQSTATPQFSSQETGRPQFGSQPSRPFSQNTLAPESSTEYPENQSTDDVPSRFGGDASRPEYNQNSQSPSQTGTQFSDGSSPLGSQTTEIPENEKPQELTTPAPFGLRPCCQGSSKFGPTARPGSSKLPSLQGPFGFNSQFNPDSPPKPSSSSFAGQGETFGGPDRKPPTFDENGYHY